MAITPIEKLPGEKVDLYKEARIRLENDILQIVRDKITLCEITSEMYTTNTMRDALKRAIRYAVVHSNHRNNVKRGETGHLDESMFSIIRRKDAEGKHHFYIEYTAEKE